jgi:hypothetical protein
MQSTCETDDRFPPENDKPRHVKCASAWPRVRILDFLVINCGVITICKIGKANQTPRKPSRPPGLFVIYSYLFIGFLAILKAGIRLVKCSPLTQPCVAWLTIVFTFIASFSECLQEVNLQWYAFSEFFFSATSGLEFNRGQWPRCPPF